PPFEGQLALPGGYLEGEGTLDETALRELREESGLDGPRLDLQMGPTSRDPKRDPRGPVITPAYLGSVPWPDGRVAGSGACEALLMPVDDALSGDLLAFDHSMILRDARERARWKLEYTTVAAAFCKEPFTVSDLRRVYEVIWGFELDPSNFRRKVT